MTYKYNGIIKNDFSAAPGVSTTIFVQGCPHKCFNCHNPETWSFNGGQEFTTETMQEVLDALKANGIKRSLSIMGGEPLCPQNIPLTLYIIDNVIKELPEIEIYVWTGYLYEELLQSTDTALKTILGLINVLIDGPYIDSERDITLKMRGSRNQRIINLKEVYKNESL